MSFQSILSTEMILMRKKNPRETCY